MLGVFEVISCRLGRDSLGFVNIGLVKVLCILEIRCVLFFDCSLVMLKLNFWVRFRIMFVEIGWLLFFIWFR